MRERIVLSGLITIALIMVVFLGIGHLAAPSTVSATIVGVNVGDWVKYSVTGNYPGLTGIDWMKIEVTKVDGTSVTTRITGLMLNGTEIPPQETILAVGSSQGGPAGIGWIIPANFKVGDTVDFGGTNMAIAQETTKTYGGINRTVVGLSVSVTGTSASIFWDKQTGLLLEASMNYGGQLLTFLASSMSMGSGGEALGLSWWIWIVIIAVVMVAVVGSVFMLRRRKHPTTTIPLQPETPPQLPSSAR